jgi:hypothetical protein
LASSPRQSGDPQHTADADGERLAESGMAKRRGQMANTAAANPKWQTEPQVIETKKVTQKR